MTGKFIDVFVEDGKYTGLGSGSDWGLGVESRYRAPWFDLIIRIQYWRITMSVRLERMTVLVREKRL